MLLENTFTVEVPVDRAWTVLTTPELGGPCVPGLTLTGHADDSFTGTLKVKLGPVPLSYAGAARFTTLDAPARRFVLEATGADERGHGSVSATLTGTLAADGPERTAVTVVSHLTIGGRPAQFGRGVVADVVDRLVEQFASCAGSSGGAGPVAAAVPASTNGVSHAGNGLGSPAAATAVAAGRGRELSVSAGVTSTSPTVGRAGPLPSEAEPIEPIDPLGSPLSPLTKLLVPVGGGVLAALVVAVVLLARRGRR